jgi:hypothetical protein
MTYQKGGIYGFSKYATNTFILEDLIYGNK